MLLNLPNLARFKLFVIAGVLVLAVPVSSFAVDWRVWSEQRKSELIQEQAKGRAEHCAVIERGLSAELAALQLEFDISGASLSVRKLAIRAKDTAFRAMNDDCPGDYEATFSQLRAFIELLVAYGGNQ